MKQEQFLNVLDRDEAEARFRAALGDLGPLATEEVPLAAALGRVLGADVESPVDVPGFDRSNIDGFAVQAADTFGASEGAPRRLRVLWRRGLRGFDATRGKLRTWIAAIAKNVARRHWRRRVIDGENFDPELAQEVLEGPATDQPPLEVREEIDALRTAIAALPVEQAKIVRMRYVEGRTTRGIAAAAGVPESTVRLRLSEATAALEEALRRRGFLAEGETEPAR